MALGTSRLSPGFPGFPVSVIHHLSVQIEKPFDQTVQNEPGRPAFIQRNGIVPDRGVLAPAKMWMIQDRVSPVYHRPSD